MQVRCELTVDLRVLGSLRLSASDGRDLQGLVRQPKRLALLAYLAVANSRGFHRRDSLLALFWPELDETHARASLNQALYVLRNALGEQAIVTRGDGEVGLSADVVWCDAPAFEAALEAGQPADALLLYGGELLEGFFVAGSSTFERWLDGERGRLRQRASAAAWAVAEEGAAAGDLVEATRWARRAADLMPADESVVRRLMSFLHLHGDRAAAIRAYEAFAWQLNKEYELEPSAQTQALSLALREEGQHPADVQIVNLATARPAILVAIRRRVPLTWVAAFLVLVSGVVGAWAWLRRSEPGPDPVIRFAIQVPDGKLVRGGVPGSTLALSPDGRRVVYLAEREGGRFQLFLRAMDQLESVALPNTRGAYLPFFSPDGAWLGYVAEGRIWKVPLDGGPAIPVCAVDLSVQGASWGPPSNEIIVFANAKGLWRVPAGGGAPRILALPDTARGIRYRWPEMLPDGQSIVFTQVDQTGFQLATLSLATGAVQLLGREGTNPHFVAPRSLLFARQDGAVLAAEFDASALEIVGPVRPVVEGIAVGIHGAAKVSVARSGTLAYIPDETSERGLVAVDRRGVAENLNVPPLRFHTARFSRDGQRIAADVISSGGSERDIWTIELSSNTLRRLTFNNNGLGPVWTHDGRRIAFATPGGGREAGFAIRWMKPDETASVETLVPAQGEGQSPSGFTSDGRTLVFQRQHPQTRRDIWILPLDADGTPRPYLRTPFDERAGAVSPDGRWLAYTSDESGLDEVYVRAFPTPGAAVRISQRGGQEPRWSRSGRELFYRSDAGMVAATVVAASPITVSKRDVLFDDKPYVKISGGVGYDVHPNGRRFVMIRRGSQSNEIIMVLNWFAQ